MKNTISRRKLVSFSGRCPVNCKHCYTYEFTHTKTKSDTDEIDSIISNLREDEDFDVVYVSHNRENFIDEEAGVDLVEALYKTLKKHIFIITRKNLNDETINRLSHISERMKADGLLLAVAVSIPANSSYEVTEDVTCIGSPDERCDCLRKLHNSNVKTVFMARPIFPNRIIPVEEILQMIKENASSIDAVVSSGLAVNPSILRRLQMTEDMFSYLPGNNAEFLIGSEAKDIKYIDVREELQIIQNYCESTSIFFAPHSMQALNHLQKKL